MNSRFFHTLLRIFHFNENISCRPISLELISWGPPLSYERERKIRRCLFTPSIKLEIKNFHAAVVVTRSNTRIALVEAKVEMFWMLYERNWYYTKKRALTFHLYVYSAGLPCHYRHRHSNFFCNTRAIYTRKNKTRLK